MTLVGDRGQEFDYARILRSTENRENFYSMLERAGVDMSKYIEI